jgi:hypothetical protein
MELIRRTYARIVAVLIPWLNVEPFDSVLHKSYGSFGIAFGDCRVAAPNCVVLACHRCSPASFFLYPGKLSVDTRIDVS